MAKEERKVGQDGENVGNRGGGERQTGGVEGGGAAGGRVGTEE